MWIESPLGTSMWSRERWAPSNGMQRPPLRAHRWLRFRVAHHDGGVTW